MNKSRLLVVLGFFFVSSVHAVTVSVFQESTPGAGDFSANPLGTIESFSTTGTLAQFYNYSSQKFTNTGSITLTVDKSHLFLVDASDGLGLFVVHDDGVNAPQGVGGLAKTKVDLLGGDTATFIQQDDPGSDTYADTGTEFKAKQSWNIGFTDGYVIGSLDGNWTVDVQFTDVLLPGQTIKNLTAWAALSSDGVGGQTELALALVEDRRVRLSMIPIPPAVWLFGSGLLGLIGIARRKKAA